MINPPSKLFPATVLTTSAATLYSVPLLPATGTLKNVRVSLTNTMAVPITATLYTDVAATAASCFLSAASIAGNETIYVDVPTLAVGDALVGKAGANTAITVHECGGNLFT